MAERPVTFNGQGFSPIGEKGRFVLPPQMRKSVKESSNGQKVLCLSLHERWKCLTGFGLSREALFEDQLLREEELAVRAGRPFDRDMRSMQLYDYQQVPFDDSGRFVLPDHLARLAGIDGALYFQGAGQFFMVWSPAELARMGEGWESAQAACQHLAADAATRGRK